jgi:hypothetical protein
MRGTGRLHARLQARALEDCCQLLDLEGCAVCLIVSVHALFEVPGWPKLLIPPAQHTACQGQGQGSQQHAVAHTPNPLVRVQCQVRPRQMHMLMGDCRTRGVAAEEGWEGVSGGNNARWG